MSWGRSWWWFGSGVVAGTQFTTAGIQFTAAGAQASQSPCAGPQKYASSTSSFSWLSFWFCWFDKQGPLQLFGDSSKQLISSQLIWPFNKSGSDHPKLAILLIRPCEIILLCKIVVLCSHAKIIKIIVLCRGIVVLIHPVDFVCNMDYVKRGLKRSAVLFDHSGGANDVGPYRWSRKQLTSSSSSMFHICDSDNVVSSVSTDAFFCFNSVKTITDIRLSLSTVIQKHIVITSGNYGLRECSTSADWRLCCSSNSREFCHWWGPPRGWK